MSNPPKTTPDGREYATLTLGGKSLEVHPELFNALYKMMGNGLKADGQVIIRIAGGRYVDAMLNNTSVRILADHSETLLRK